MSELEKENQAATEAQSGSLLDEIMELTNIDKEDESFGIAKEGVQAFMAELLKSDKKDERVRKAMVDVMIAEVDEQLSLQLDEILHNEEFQKMESAWRGLKYLVGKTDFRANNKIDVLNVSKDDLEMDFDDASDIVESALYKKVYSAEYGTYGGEPYSSIIANYEFDNSSPSVRLMQNMSSVAAMAHAPVIAAASPKFFGVKDIEGIATKNSLSEDFKGPQYAKWNSFRETEDARYFGLTVPRFLLRLPYDSENNPVKAFDYSESVNEDHSRYCWGNTSFAFAARLNDSFAKYAWCPNIIGPTSGGSVEDLPLHQYEAMGQLQTKTPTEVLVTDQKEFELAQLGFIPLTFQKGKDNAAFFSANSAQKPLKFGVDKESKAKETNFKLGTQLPYMYVINRLAHYIKTIQRRNLGSGKSALELQDELKNWIKQYCNDSNSSSDQGKWPLKSANVIVSEIDGEPGFYKVALEVQPHFKYQGANFTLSLKGKLDLEQG